MICFQSSSYTKHLAHPSFLNAQEWLKPSLQYLEVLSVFVFFVGLVFPCIILLYLCVLLPLLIYENGICLWNTYFQNFFSSIWLGLKPYFAECVLFKLPFAFFISSFGVTLLPDLFSIILLFRRIFFSSLIFCSAAKTLPLLVLALNIIMLFDALSLFVSFCLNSWSVWSLIS